MNKKPYHDILDSAAADSLSRNADLWPKIAAKLERKSPMFTLRTRPAMAVLIALIVLLALSGVAYAIGRSLGFIPGIGMVEQASSMRTIAEPVSIEREGIRFTIVNVIASPATTSIRYQVEWLTPPPTTGEIDTSCQGVPSLTLPDGTTLNFVQTTDKFMVGEPGLNAGYGYVMEFAPIPADQIGVTLVYPCLVPLAPGPLPRDWTIPFRLVPAPEGMILPVVESTPEAAASAVPTEDAVSPSAPTPLVVDSTHRVVASIDSYVLMDDGYLLIGSMTWSASDYPAYAVNPIAYLGNVTVTDANGQPVAWEEVYDNVTPQNEEYRSYWAIKVATKNFAAPLTVTISAANVTIQPVPFTFDVGAAPQAGQSWDVNQTLQLFDSAVQIVKASLVSSENGLSFQLDVQVDASVVGDLYVITPLTQCMGGGGGYPTERRSQFQIFMPMCRTDLPPGAVEMQVIGAVVWGQWQVTWQP